MGTCTFCGESAGFFRTRHDTCAANHAAAIARDHDNAILASEQKGQAKQALANDTFSTVRAGGNLVDLEHRLLVAIGDELIVHAEMTSMLVSAYERCVEAYLDDGLLDDQEQANLEACRDRFALSPKQLDKNGAFSRAQKAAVLKTIMEGYLPPPPDTTGCVVNFQKGETPVWIFRDCQYMEDVVRRQIVGRSQGMSFRIMRGVYYRVGGFKGESVTTLQRKHLGPGELILTDMNIYFAGYGKTTRIPYTKVVSFTPFSDGFGLMRDAATAKPQFFITGDGWFVYNLVANLAKLPD